MSDTPPTLARGVPLLVALALAACVPPPPPTNADQAALHACRVRAEQIYAQQSRGADTLPTVSDSPFAAGGLPSDTTAGLSARYGYDRIVDRCLRGSEANTELGAGQPAAAAAPPAAQRPADAAPLAGPAPGAPLSAPPP